MPFNPHKIYFMSRKLIKELILTGNNFPIVNPEIVTAIIAKNSSTRHCRLVPAAVRLFIFFYPVP